MEKHSLYPRYSVYTRCGVICFDNTGPFLGEKEPKRWLVHYVLDQYHAIRITSVYEDIAGKLKLVDMHHWYIWHRKLQFVRRINRKWL